MVNFNFRTALADIEQSASMDHYSSLSGDATEDYIVRDFVRGALAEWTAHNEKISWVGFVWHPDSGRKSMALLCNTRDQSDYNSYRLVPVSDAGNDADAQRMIDSFSKKVYSTKFHPANKEYCLKIWKNCEVRCEAKRFLVRSIPHGTLSLVGKGTADVANVGWLVVGVIDQSMQHAELVELGARVDSIVAQSRAVMSKSKLELKRDASRSILRPSGELVCLKRSQDAPTPPYNIVPIPLETELQSQDFDDLVIKVKADFKRRNTGSKNFFDTTTDKFEERGLRLSKGPELLALGVVEKLIWTSMLPSTVYMVKEVLATTKQPGEIKSLLKSLEDASKKTRNQRVIWTGCKLTLVLKRESLIFALDELKASKILSGSCRIFVEGIEMTWDGL